MWNAPIQTLQGQATTLAANRGKALLLVNVASKCGYTPQYTGLERLHGELSAEGFTVVGFPCNQFGGQESGSDLEIREFCSTRYDVTFPLASKLEVNGPGRHALYAWLTAAANGHPGDIAWNFEKFLIGRGGQLLARYPSGTKPEDKGLMADIAAALQGA